MRIVLYSHVQYNMKIAQDCSVTCHDIQLTLLTYFFKYSRKKKHNSNIGSGQYFGGPKNLSIEVNTPGIQIIEINLIATGNRMITIYDQVTMVARESETFKSVFHS